MNLTSPLLLAGLGLALGIAAGYFIRQYFAQKQADSAENKIKSWIDEAKTRAKETVLEAKDRAANLLEEVKSEEKSRQLHLDKLEERILKKEETLEKQFSDIASQKKSFEEKEKEIKLEKEGQEEIEKRSLNIITTAIQRYARSHITELTTSVFQLPDEDLKEKIIGREGRNIRSLERLTGVEIIVEETPDTIVFSSYDPLPRKIARLALEK